VPDAVAPIEVVADLRARKAPRLPKTEPVEVAKPVDATYDRRVTDELRCAECDRTPRDDENPLDEWRCYSDGCGELVTMCPECSKREFGENAPAGRTSSLETP
jgi:hypothetical protein